MDLLAMLREHSYRKGTFQLASGRTSDFFIDCKATVLRAEGHVLAGRALLDAIRSLDSEVVAVAGVALGGCPLASAVAMCSTDMCSTDKGDSLDAIYVRKTAKGHGTGRSIEGAAHLALGAVVVLVEDTVTTGGSSLRAVKELQDAGYEVAAVLALVDREEGAKEAFEAAGVAFKPLYSRSEF